MCIVLPNYQTRCKMPLRRTIVTAVITNSVISMTNLINGKHRKCHNGNSRRVFLAAMISRPGSITFLIVMESQGTKFSSYRS